MMLLMLARIILEANRDCDKNCTTFSNECNQIASAHWNYHLFELKTGRGMARSIYFVILRRGMKIAKA
jgi:hypothetical protein